MCEDTDFSKDPQVAKYEQKKYMKELGSQIVSRSESMGVFNPNS